MSLINCKIELDLPWLNKCVISEISRTFRAFNPSRLKMATATTGAIFKINNSELYVPVATLSINDNIQFLENIK